MNSHVVGKVPRIARAAALAVLCIAGGVGLTAVMASAQDRQLTGRVVDADGNAPVPGAAVTVVGTALGTVTNDSGVFHIRVPGAAVVINARRIGFTPRNVPVAADQADVTIGLIKDVLELEATVVTGTATTISSRNAANGVTVLNTDQITQVPAATLDDAMQGKIPGAIIQQNNGGAPGGGMQIQIRGVTSINSDASALYVVDGVPINNGHINDGANAISGANDNTITQSTQDNPPNRIADINPEDIESIEILKGASAAAQYGSRAGGGVVLITTKKGTPGKAKWDLTGKVGTFLPENFLNLRQFPTAASAEAWYNAYKATPSAPWSPSLYQGNNPMQTQLFGGGEASYEGDLSVRGQSGQTQYYASLLSKYDNGLMVNTGYNKQGGRVNLTQSFSEAITGNLNMYFAHSNDRRGITGNDNIGISPYDIFSVTPGFFNQEVKTATGAYQSNPYGLGNAYQDAAYIQTPEEVSRFIGGGNVDARIFQTDRQSLHLTALAGADIAHQTDDFYAPPDIQIETNQPLPGVATSLNGDNTYLNYNVNLVHHYAGGTNFDATTSIGIGRDQRYLYNPYSVGQQLPPGIAQVTAGAVQHNYDTTVVSRTFDILRAGAVPDARPAAGAERRYHRRACDGQRQHQHVLSISQVQRVIPGAAICRLPGRAETAWCVGAFGYRPDFRRAVCERQQSDAPARPGCDRLVHAGVVQRPGDQAGDEHGDRDWLRRDDVLIAGAILGDDLSEAHYRPAAAGEHTRQLGQYEPVAERRTVHRPRHRAVTLGDARSDTQEPDVGLHVDLLPELQRDGRAAGSGIRAGDELRPGVRTVLGPGGPVADGIRQHEQLVRERVLPTER